MPKLLSVSPDRLRPNTYNPNYVSPENETKLARSMEELGQFKPIIVRQLRDEASDTDFEILGGEHRWQAATAAKMSEIDVYDLGVVDDSRAKKIALADNARYGADDTLALAKLLGEVGTPDEIQQFLPYTDADISTIFSSLDIALDELDLPDSIEDRPEKAEPAADRVPKTHTIMRFKVPLTDAERITEVIARTQKRHDFNSSDELTNAGDALVHLIFADKEEA